MKVVSKTGKVYYKSKSRKSAVLVDKRGRLVQKNINALRDKIENSNASAAEKRRLKADLDAYTQNAKGQLRDHSMTENSFLAHNKTDKTARMLANLGYDVSSLADELGVSENDILNADWDDNHSTVKIAGVEYSFTFKYTGSAFKKI